MDIKLRLTRKRAGLVAVVAALAVTGGVAYATIPGGGGVYSACMLNSTGLIRLIDTSLPPSSPLSHCYSNETLVSWNQSGPPGGKGDRGPTGPQGSKGAQGPTGAPGVRGPSGPAGANGLKGATGAQGVRGPSGSVGATGLRGLTGVDGEDGQDGQDGQDGARGPTGTPGAQGPTGAMGPTGARGPTGAQGATGATGVDGPRGPTGARGATGARGVDGSRGPTGARGVDGVSGPTGEAGPTGPQGSAGSRGEAGQRGPTGAKGDTGAPGGLDVVTSLNGDGFLATTRNPDGTSRMTNLLTYGAIPGSYVAILTVDLENSSNVGGVVRCELAAVNNALYARARQYVAPLVGVDAGGGSMTLTTATFFPTGTTLVVRCTTFADGPTLPTIQAAARLLLIPTSNIH
jgi:hypothetical protein